MTFVFENEEIHNVKKTIGESKISESTTGVVVKGRFFDSRRFAARSNKQDKCDPHARRERRTQAGGPTLKMMYSMRPQGALTSVTSPNIQPSACSIERIIAWCGVRIRAIKISVEGGQFL